MSALTGYAGGHGSTAAASGEGDATQRGKKIIGRKQFPNSSETFPNKKAATIINDTIDFHGATVNVAVHNAYRSRLFERSKLDISVAADRIVRVEDGDIECWLDTRLAKLTLRKHK